MRLAILVPLRNPGSGGFFKHFNEVISCWIRNKNFREIGVYTSNISLEKIKELGVKVNHVPYSFFSSDYSNLNQILKRNKYDVAFCVTARPLKSIYLPLVTLVQNIEPIQKPIYKMPILWRMRRLYLRREHKIACRKSNRIIAVSNYVKNEVCRNFKVKSQKVDVVYHGFNQADTRSLNKPDILKFNSSFLFSAGSIVPYRGYEDIIRAVSFLISKGREDLRIVFAGSKSKLAKQYIKFLRKLAKSNKLDDKIVWTGQLSHNEMTWCFQNSKLFIQTSRAESFSNIQVEAMGNRCICISCDQSPMPEILRNAAIYYKINNYRSLASKIQEALEMSDKEKKLIRKIAIKRAKFFSWEKTAEETFASLNQAAL